MVGQSITPDTPKLDALLAYAALGWKAFLLSATKSPVRNCEPCTEEHLTSEQREACECLTCHGFYAATLDPDRLAEMVRRIPDGLIAIRAGAASSIVVVDIDTEEEHEADGFTTSLKLQEAGVLPATLTAVTPSGGVHLVYAHPGGYMKGGAHKLGTGVDVKGEGGYFVAAPSHSRKHDAAYRWVDDSIDTPLAPLHPRIAAHLAPRPAPERRTVREGYDSSAPRNVHARLRGLVDTVLNSGSGRRNDTLNWAAHKAGIMVGAGEIDEHTAFEVLRDAALATGLTSAEVGHDSGHGTIGSGLRAGMRSA